MDAIARYAELDPDAPAVIDGERRVSWHDYHLARNRLAHALGDLDVAAGEHVVLYAHNSLDVLLAAAAVRALGAIPVPMNHRLTAEEVAYILGDSDAVALFAGDAFLPIVERVRGQAPRLRHVVLLGAERRPWARHVDELLAAGSPAPVAAPPGLGGSMVYTAGTTGKPKGARRRATDPAAMLPRLAALHCIDPHDVHLVAGPLYHSAPGAFALYAHALGQTVVVLRKFDAEDALRVIERHRCTTTFMAPTLLKRLVDLPAAVRGRYDVSSMRSIVVAAAPCPMRVKEAVLAWFGPVLYEFCSLIALVVRLDHVGRTIGRLPVLNVYGHEFGSLPSRLQGSADQPRHRGEEPSAAVHSLVHGRRQGIVSGRWPCSISCFR